MSAEDKHDGDAPAFPEPFQGHCLRNDHADPCGCYLRTGITIRDYFAAAAIPSVTAWVTSPDQVARSAYRLADEMLKARSETSGKVTS